MFERLNVWQSFVAIARQIGEKLASPIVRQFPIFLICIGVCGTTTLTLRRIHALMISPDPKLSMERQWELLAFYCLIAYVYALVNDMAARRWVKVMSYSVIVALFLVELFLDYNFKLIISPQVMMLIGETTSHEAGEFLSTTLMSPASLSAYFHIALLILVIIVLEAGRKWLARLFDRRWIKAVASALSAAVIVGGLYSSFLFYGKLFRCQTTDDVLAYVGIFYNFPSDPYTKLVFSIFGLQLTAEEMDRALAAATHGVDRAILTETDSLDVVLVIGESYIKRHAGLYGYALQTTPFLSRECEQGRLFVFDNVVSPYNFTSRALRNVFFCNSVGDGERWYEASFIPMIFKQASYNVLFWDNQFSMNRVLEFALNTFLYNPQICRLSYSQTNEEGFELDGDIVADFAQKARLGTHNFVMFHLMGQHVDFAERYPHDGRFDHFTADSVQRNEEYLTVSKRQKIAEYDNATLYNDHILQQIVSQFANRNAVLVYFSDHGEEVYDYRDSMGRKRGSFSKDLLQCQYEIPFMIWCSDLFKANHPELCSQIAASVHRSMMTDNLCHLLFHLAGIETSVYNPVRDVLSTEYSCPRRLLEDCIDYDEVMDNASAIKVGSIN